MREYNPITNTFIKVSGGGTGTSNYNDLENKPSINDVPLIGNKTLTQLGINFNDYYTKDETYTKLEVDNLIPSTEDFATKEELNSKQDLLTAGANITIENNVISASGGSGTIDTEMSPTSENAVQNKVITSYVDDMYNGLLQALEEGYQPILTEGEGIDITTSNQISIDNTVALKSEVPNINVEYLNDEVSAGEITQGNKKIRLTSLGVEGVNLSISDGTKSDDRTLADTEYLERYGEQFAKGGISSSSLGSIYAEDPLLRLSLNAYKNNLPEIVMFDHKNSVVEFRKTLATQDYVDTELSDKQDTLVSGTNIKKLENIDLLGNGTINVKTINNESVLDSGNITTAKVTYDTEYQVATIREGDTEVQLNKETNDTLRVQEYAKDDRGQIQNIFDVQLPFNFKTINNQNIIGSGNITIQGGDVEIIDVDNFNMSKTEFANLFFSDKPIYIKDGYLNHLVTNKYTWNMLPETIYELSYIEGNNKYTYKWEVTDDIYYRGKNIDSIGTNYSVGTEKWYGTFTENNTTYQVYTKTIFVPALSSTAGITTYDHGIINIKQILGVFGFGTNGFVLNSPRQNAEDNIAIYQVSKSATNRTFSIEVGKDRSNMGAYVTLIYAKNN